MPANLIQPWQLVEWTQADGVGRGIVFRVHTTQVEVRCLSVEPGTEAQDGVTIAPGDFEPEWSPDASAAPGWCDRTAAEFFSPDRLRPLGPRLKTEKIDVLMRAEIRDMVARHYSEVHQRPQRFVPGESSIRYAGRVFDEREVQALVDSSLDFWLTLGPRGKEFERGLARYVGTRFCILVNSGSSANLLAFTALTSPLLGERRVRPGSEVITVAAGFPTTVSPIVQNRCVPVFVDITPETRNIDVGQLEAARSDRTRAVMVAHTLGNPIDLDAVIAFCRRYDLFLIEDNCDALGSLYRGRKTGSFGHVATQSFYPPHHITLGEGGAVLTSDAKIKRAVESFRDWGRDCWCDSGKDNTCGKRFAAQYGQLPLGYDHKYVYSHFGYNLKPLDLQAAIGSVQLERLEAFGASRRRNFQRFSEAFRPYADRFILPEATAGADPSWFGFALTVRPDAGFTRKEIVDFLEERKVQTRMLFAGNIIRQPLFDELRDEPGRFRTVGSLRHTDEVMENTFWLGVYPGLTGEQMSYICESVDVFMQQAAAGARAVSV